MGELWQTYNQADAKRQIGGEKFSQREDKKGVGGGGGVRRRLRQRKKKDREIMVQMRMRGR